MSHSDQSGHYLGMPPLLMLLLVGVAALGTIALIVRAADRVPASSIAFQVAPEHCVACGARVDLDRNDRYTCGVCGLDSALTRQPALRGQVEPLRDLRAALDSVLEARRSFVAKEYETARHHLSEAAGLLRDHYRSHSKLLERSAAGVAVPNQRADDALLVAGMISPILTTAVSAVAIVENAGRAVPKDAATIHRESLQQIDAWIADITHVRDELGQGLLARLQNRE